MNIKAYQKKVHKRRTDDYDTETDNLIQAALGLASEAGEVCNLF